MVELGKWVGYAEVIGAQHIEENSMKYIIRYVYDNPSGAGPFKGKITTLEPYLKGDTIFAPFGRATVVSCRKTA
jgi:hypothetical protein